MHQTQTSAKTLKLEILQLEKYNYTACVTVKSLQRYRCYTLQMQRPLRNAVTRIALHSVAVLSTVYNHRLTSILLP